MGGGEDSRIPAILTDGMPHVCTIVRTYDFDPEIAYAQIKSWVEELHPDLLVGESLGATHALCVPDVPVLLVSPALGAPRLLRAAAPFCRFRSIRVLLERRYRREQGRRQSLYFSPSSLRKWPVYRHMAIETPHPDVRAFFGKKDHFRRSGVVSIHDYRKIFGNTYSMYDGSHFMEERYVRGMLAPAIEEILT